MYGLKTRELVGDHELEISWDSGSTHSFLLKHGLRQLKLQ